MVLSDWVEHHKIELPEEHYARPGRYRHWPYMRAIFDAMGDSIHERVSVMKSARLGYTKALMIAMGAIAATNPSQIMLLMPTDEDANEIAVDEVEPMFEANPIFSGLIKRTNNGKNNTKNKQMTGGGSLKIRSGRAPRKLRRLDVKILMIDEADGFEITKEGDAIALAEGRTLAKADRKIIVGSTPTEEGISVVERLFGNGNMQIYEVPCPKCGVFSEIVWDHIEYELDESGSNIASAHWRCPHCRTAIDERWKPQMLDNGRWRALRPQVTDHASFRINALVSLLPNATWPKLAKLWVEAQKGGTALKMVFRNTILGLPWRVSINRVDAATLMARAENWGLASPGRLKVIIPPEVLMILVGSDVQDDRIECTIMGVGIGGEKFILGHVIHEGNTLMPDVWKRLDRWHRDFYVMHPNGWQIAIDAMSVDSGGREGRTQVVYDWCGERVGRQIYAIKGEVGPNKRVWRKAAKVKGGARLAILSVDVLKTMVLDSLGAAERLEDDSINPHILRFSNSLEETWYEQVTNEVRRVKYKENRPVIEFKPKTQGARVEALDCTAYAFALLECPAVKLIDLNARFARRKIHDTRDPAPARPKRRSIAEIAAEMNKKSD